MTKEQVSEGASGAFFFRTDDERLFVKELTEEESRILRDTALDYAQHVEENKRTLLPRFYGCYALTVYGHTLHFMVRLSCEHTTCILCVVYRMHNLCSLHSNLHVHAFYGSERLTVFAEYIAGHRERIPSQLHCRN
jgi:hypothetical protein